MTATPPYVCMSDVTGLCAIICSLSAAFGCCANFYPARHAHIHTYWCDGAPKKPNECAIVMYTLRVNVKQILMRNVYDAWVLARVSVCVCMRMYAQTERFVERDAYCVAYWVVEPK